MTARSRAAPPVAQRVGRSAVLGALLLVVWLAGAGILFSALWRGQYGRWPSLLLCAALALAGVAALQFWRCQQQRVLVWDGGQWLLVPSGRAPDARRDAVQLAVAQDLQFAVLLYCRAAGGQRHWLWLQRGDAARWHALRSALYGSGMPH